jgi:hypothetical protein
MPPTASLLIFGAGLLSSAVVFAVSDDVWIALITMVGTSIASVIGVLALWVKLQHQGERLEDTRVRVKEANAVAVDNNERLQAIHLQIDGRTTEMLRSATAAGEVRGMIEAHKQLGILPGGIATGESTPPRDPIIRLRTGDGAYINLNPQFGPPPDTSGETPIAPPETPRP